jgi:hypothetical protein
MRISAPPIRQFRLLVFGTLASLGATPAFAAPNKTQPPPPASMPAVDETDLLSALYPSYDPDTDWITGRQEVEVYGRKAIGSEIYLLVSRTAAGGRCSVDLALLGRRGKNWKVLARKANIGVDCYEERFDSVSFGKPLAVEAGLTAIEVLSSGEAGSGEPDRMLQLFLRRGRGFKRIFEVKTLETMRARGGVQCELTATVRPEHKPPRPAVLRVETVIDRDGKTRRQTELWTWQRAKKRFVRQRAARRRPSCY